MTSTSHTLERSAGHGSDRRRSTRSPESPIAEATCADTVTLAGRIAGFLTAGASVVALLVHVVFSTVARRWLSFPFAGLPANWAVAAGIFLNNLRALGAVLGLLLIAQSLHRSTGVPGRAQRMVVHVGEVVLGAAVVGNVVVVGASLGAYGTRMARAVLPHGPLELAAYALALALHLEARERPLAPTHIVAVVLLSVITLAVAAGLETFVNL